MSNPQPIGIDFGTTKTLVCRWDERRRQPVEIRLGRLGPMPTSIHVDSTGKPDLFGDDADDNQVFDPSGYVSRVKRYLGRKAPLVLHGKIHDPVSLVSEFLRHLRSRIEEEALHGPVGHTVITVPALFGPAAKASLRQAAESAGFSDFELLDEPVAGGLAFLHDSPETVPGQNFLVFDWGGGTLDLAVVRREDENLVEVPNLLGGDLALGGEDIDDSIVEGVSAMLTSQQRPSLEGQEEKYLTHARRALKAGKELLSRKQDHSFRFELGDGPLAFAWDRAQFEEFIESPVERAVFQTKRLVEKAVAASVTLDGIILIGGSSKFPMIERRLAEVTGIKILKYDHSQEAVARGAVLRARVRVSRVPAPITSATNCPPPVPPQFRKESVRANGGNSDSPTPSKAPDADARAETKNWESYKQALRRAETSGSFSAEKRWEEMARLKEMRTKLNIQREDWEAIERAALGAPLDIYVPEPATNPMVAAQRVATPASSGESNRTNAGSSAPKKATVPIPRLPSVADRANRTKASSPEPKKATIPIAPSTSLPLGGSLASTPRPPRKEMSEALSIAIAIIILAIAAVVVFFLFVFLMNLRSKVFNSIFG